MSQRQKTTKTNRKTDTKDVVFQSIKNTRKKSKNILKKMLTKNNKNVIIENVDSDKQNLRKSKFAGKIKQKIF